MKVALPFDYHVSQVLPGLEPACQSIETLCDQLLETRLSMEAAQPFYRLLFIKESAPYNDTIKANLQNVYQQLTLKVFDRDFRFELTPELACDINRQVLEGLPLSTRAKAGQIRWYETKIRNALDNTLTPVLDPQLCQQELETLCKRMTGLFAQRTPGQQRFEAVVYALLFHYAFVVIHPFADANGRTARALEAYLLMAGGIPLIACNLLSNLYNHNRSEMQKALELSRAGGEFPHEFINYGVAGFTHLLKQVAEKAATLEKNMPPNAVIHRLPVYESNRP